MAEVTDKRGSDDTEAIGDGGMELGEGDQEIQDAGIHQRDPAIDQVAPEIFPPSLSSGMKHQILITEEGVGDRQHIRRDDQNKIMNPRIQKIMERRIDDCAEHGIPSAHDQIPQRLVLRRTETGHQVID